MIKFSAYKILDTAEGKMPLDVSFHLEKGQLITLFGKSGTGKTTILRILAGLTKADKSLIEVENETWDHAEKKIHIAVQRRSIGFVFQDYALFPNLTVKENLEFALPHAKDRKMVSELMQMMELDKLQNIRPTQLSGGQKQRVALARAIARKPKILLLDEPLSAVDDEMRLKLQDYIYKVHQYYKLTTIFVSHHLPEIFRLSDHVIILDKGKIIKQGKPVDVFTEQRISNKFEVTGEVIEIRKSDIAFVVSIISQNNIIKILATESEVEHLKVGSKVLVVSKLFNPLIQIIN
ncbi:MAG TPA: ATP-binding cassette domain-containing protein [Puia sp.]|nr:ATP-binding cassette domain-containing protein [Puia sp.]